MSTASNAWASATARPSCRHSKLIFLIISPTSASCHHHFANLRDRVHNKGKHHCLVVSPAVNLKLPTCIKSARLNMSLPACWYVSPDPSGHVHTPRQPIGDWKSTIGSHRPIIAVRITQPKIRARCERIGTPDAQSAKPIGC